MSAAAAAADEERDLERKRGSLGGPKVFESKKEKKRRLILSDSESEEDSVSPCRRADPGAEQNGSGSVVEKRNDLEPARCKEELKDEVMRWDTDKKKLEELWPDKEEHKSDKKRSSSSDVKRREEDGTTDDTGIDKKVVKELGSDREELKIDKKWSLSSEAFKLMEEPAELGSHKEVPYYEKRFSRLDMIKQWEEAGTRKKKYTELGSDEDELKFDKKKAMSSDAVKQREKAAGLGSELKVDKQKAMEADILKQRKEACIRKMRVTEPGLDCKTGRKRSREAVLPSNKKVDGIKKVHICKEGEEQRRTSTPCTTGNHRSAKQSSLSGGKKLVEKPSSIVASDKRQLNMKKLSSSEKHKSHEANTKMEAKIPLADKHKSLKGKTDLKSSGKPDPLVKGKSVSTLENTLLSNKQKMEDAGEGRATVIRKIRDQIKDTLLSAGWKIDLRPRRGRDYEDQVYVPPTGGGGYWSITKAYAVFQNQLDCARDDKSKNSSKMSTESDHNAIPTEVLNMLKRKVVNKRRRRIEDDETQGSRSKKAKGATKMKGPKNKSKEKTGGVRGRKKLNSGVGSNAKGVSSTAQNLRRVSVKSKKSQRGCALLVRDANQQADSEYDDYVPYIWKRTVLSWMIDLGVVPFNGKVKYMNKKQTRTMLEGRITRDGINCSCCSKVLTVSKFEIHAGSKLHQPYENIFVQESGLSLLQCQLNAWEKQESERQDFSTVDIEGEDQNDDTCGICGDGGDLICCDGCPSTFHQSCLGIEVLPPGDWHCAYCTCRYCRIVSEHSTQGSSVAVSPLLSCFQCEEKYHQECIPEADAISVSSNNSHVSFCGRSCRKVFRKLQKLLGAKNDLEAGFSWRLIRRLHEDSPRSSYALPQRAECNANIAVALAVMDECFLPIVDPRTGINLIHNVVYNCGSNINRLSYNGFYTFILERGDEIICAASVRIHGTRLAEMPFIGTRNMYRRQGMCRRLLNGVESALCSLGIEKLIIPAISELTETWTTVFGFKPLKFSQKQEVKSMNMLVFHSTGLLQKPLLKKHSAVQHITTDEAEKPEIKHHNMLKVAVEPSVSPSHTHNEATIHSRPEAEDVEPSFLTLQGCVHSTTSNVAPESLSASHGSEFQDQEYKSPENMGNDLLIHPEAVCHDTPVHGDEFLPCSSTVPRIKFPCEGTVHDHHDIEIEGSGVVSNMHAVDDALVQLVSEAKCTSPATTDSTQIEASRECIVDDNHGMKDQITTLQPKLNAICDNSGHSNSEIITGSIDLDPDKFLAACMESSIHAVGEAIVDDIHDVKADAIGKERQTSEGSSVTHVPDILTSGPLNKISGSTTVVVPPDLTVGHEDTSDVPVEPSLAYSVVASDTDISTDELAVVKPAHAFGTSSHCASEVATKSLENGLSTNGSADASIL